MRKEKIILVLGIWVAILPYLGFPLYLKNILLVVTGLELIYIGYTMFKNSKIGKKKTFDNFSENDNFEEKEIKNEHYEHENMEETSN